VKKFVLAIFLFVAGLVLIVPTYMNADEYSRIHRSTTRAREVSLVKGIDVPDWIKQFEVNAETSFRIAVFCAIGSLTALALAVTFYLLHRRGLKARMG
jgi:hypothetical protein